MLRFKPEVEIIFPTLELHTIFQAAALWSLRTRVAIDVNSIDDGAGIHQANSLHGYSLAVDLDTAGDKTTDTRELAEFLRRVLEPQFDIVFEGDHVHVEWDARRPPMKG